MNVKFAQKRTLFLLFLGLTLLGAACGEAGDGTDETPDVTENNDSGGTAGYPAADGGYPGPESGYPVEALGLEGALGAEVPPAELPTFPGQIAFQTERYLSVQVAIMDGASGATTRFSQNLPQTFEPSWSPDCSQLVFSVGQGEDENFDLYTQAFADMGQEAASLLYGEPDSYDWSAAWSPAGDVIAYQNNRTSLINICFVDTQGNPLGCMEQGNYSNAMPAWSPDGSQFVFGTNRDGNWELYLTDYPEMSSMTRLTENNDIDFHPEISPDGSSIVFTSRRGADYNLFTINPDGSNEQQITSDGGDERDPAWVGNDQIVYAGGFEDEMELFLINADGTNKQRLSYSPGIDQWPVWCPTP